jgi:hypothetical protein
MLTLGKRLLMLKQMRWREAQRATGAQGDGATDRLIRLHNAVTALEATALDGPPEGIEDLDLDGYGLTSVGRSVEQVNSDAYDRHREREQGGT